jgi:hypothetical protein
LTPSCSLLVAWRTPKTHESTALPCQGCILQCVA